jgi:multiple sugar transport system permease protein
MPALATVAVFNFLGSWNDLFGPLIFLSTKEKMTVTLGLTYLRGRGGTGAGQWGVIMAGSLLGIIPMIILYSVGQKYFVQGLARAGLKG